MAQIIREVHGIPLWLLKEYLVELGGQVQDDHHVSGDGWQAYFHRIEDFKIGSIVIGRVRLELSGNDKRLEEIMPPLETKLMRGGG